VTLDPEARAELREDLDRLRLGQDMQGRPVLLPAGMKWEAVGHTAHEAELIEQRKLAREEVAATYMIPPPMLGQLDRATYANITTQREMAYTDALGPPLVLVEQVFNAQLIAGLLREKDIFVEFDFAGVLRGDRLKEIQAIRQAIGTALMSPNEGRRVLNMPSSDSPAADELYLPSNNLSPLSEIGKGKGDNDQTDAEDS
jgi:HK97 family phage portal protein